MNKYVVRLFFLFFLLVGFSSCSDFQRVMKSDNIDEKYQAAAKYYEKGDYYKAGMLLEELIPILRGRSEAERAQFMYANSHFAQKQYLLAAYYFKTLYETYPRGEFAEEAQFLQARSLYYDSPRYYLDQSSTVDAMAAFQSFIEKNPNSRFAPQADSLYNDLAVKIERKSYENAKLYHGLRQYKSAVVALGNFLRDYPASPYAEEVAFLRIDSQLELAKASVPERQAERYDEVIDFYLQFIDKYPQSKQLRAAEQRYAQAMEQVQRLKVSSLNKP